MKKWLFVLVVAMGLISGVAHAENLAKPVPNPPVIQPLNFGDGG